ncbi:hypothetical protein [Actinomadura sp. NTSP31]|uniref:hypothetical protein n=1 Tax=Actinomadura sp. NTSP31 TaxID=1735447 RepID=UPI0035BEC153
MTETDVRRAMNAAVDRLAAEYQKWQVGRLTTASMLLDKPPKELLFPDGSPNELLLAFCRMIHGEPDGPESAPKMRLDRRFKANRLPYRGSETP